MKIVHKYKELIGWLGAGGFLCIYILNSMQIISSQDIIYHIMNLIASILLALRVLVDNNYSNLLLEISFAVIAIYYIVKIIFFM